MRDLASSWPRAGLFLAIQFLGLASAAARVDSLNAVRDEANALAIDISHSPRNLQENLEAHREKILGLAQRLNRIPGRELGYGPLTAVQILRNFASHRSGLADELLAEFSGWTAPEVRDFVATIRRLKQDPPELALTSTRGEPLALAGMRGKIVLVDVWNMHCEGCIETIPKLRTFYSQYRGRDFEIMGVCALFSPEEEADARRFMEKHGVTWPNAFIPAKRQREVLSALGASDGGGQYLLLDQTGRLVSADISGNWLGYYLDKLLPPSWPVRCAKSLVSQHDCGSLRQKASACNEDTVAAGKCPDRFRRIDFSRNLPKRLGESVGGGSLQVTFRLAQPRTAERHHPMRTTRTGRICAPTWRFVHFVVCALAAIAFGGGISPVYGQDAVPKRQFDLPAGEATKTLRMFSEQSGRPLVADTDLVRDVKTNAVKGEYSVEEAMGLLLDNTGLIASQDAKSGAYTVRKGDAVPNARRAALASVSPNQTSPTEADKETDASVVHLSRFEVTAKTDKGYGATQSISGSRFAIPIEDLAATLITVTPKLMIDINPNEPSDAAKYVAGVNTATAKYGGQYTVRGYNIVGVNHRDGLPETSIVASTGGGTTDFAGIERMEIIEGPNGILYGAQTVGGLINFVSKKPSPIYSSSATAQYGSFDFYRLDLSSTGPLTQDKNLLFRVDGAIQDAKLQMGLPYKKTTIVPYLEYRFGPRTKVWGRFNYLHGEVASDTASWYMDYNNTFSSFMGTRQYLGEKDEVREMTYRDAEMGISTSVDAGSATWDFRLVGRFNNFSWDQTAYNVSNYNLLDATGAIIGHVGTGATSPATDVFSNPAIKSIVALRNRQYNPEINHDGLVTFDAVGNFDVGPVKNTLLTNLQLTINNFTRHIWRWDYPSAQVYPTVQHVSGDPLAAATNKTLITNFQSNNHQFAFGFQDNASMLNDRVILIFGARYDYSQQTDNNLLLNAGGLETSIHQWTYKAGAIVKPIEHVSLFYDYSETFNPASNRDPNTNRLFPNLLGVMNEVGAKGELFNSRLVATLSYFDILLQNAVTFVNDPNGGPGSLVNQGDATTKGWDLNLTATPVKGLNLIAGIGNLSSKTQAGIRRRGVPQGTSYKIFATYEFAEGSLNGFKFGGGYEFENKRAGNTVDTLKLASYDLIELMAAYNHGPWRLQLNVYNAADKIFAFTSVNANKIWPVEPRTYRLTVGYGF